VQLIIMRHGEAGFHSVDDQRELTEYGRRSVAEVAAQIGESPWRPLAMWCSPLVRAQQTAAIVSKILNCPVQEKNFITPDDDPGKCLDAILEAPDSPLMIVSHMPLVGSLATLFVDGHKKGIPMITAQAIVLDIPVAGPGYADLKAQFMA
jgi:phosphohistidine phosphatase